MVSLNFSIIVLKYNFHESPVCTIDHRSSKLRSALEWPHGEIKRVYSLEIIQVSKPQRCCRRRIWNAIECRSMFLIDNHWCFIFQQKHLGHIDWSISERSLRIGPCSTSTHVPPDRVQWALRMKARKSCIIKQRTSKYASSKGAEPPSISYQKGGEGEKKSKYPNQPSMHLKCDKTQISARYT